MIAGNDKVGPDLDRMAGHKVRPLVQVGQTFGRLRVIAPDRRLHGKRAAVVRCACGAADRRVRYEHLLSGDIKAAAVCERSGWKLGGASARMTTGKSPPRRAEPPTDGRSQTCSA